MSTTINTNPLSLIAQTNLNRSQAGLSVAIERLSSGSRINSAKDDAAGQAISNRMTTQIKGMHQSSRNANDGISMVQTTEGALNEVSNNLQRIRELAVQAKNGSNSQSDLSSIQDEVKARLGEIDRIAGKTAFNGINLLDGSAGKNGVVTFQVGENDGDTIEIDLSSSKSDTETLGIKDLDLSVKKEVKSEGDGTVTDPDAGAEGKGVKAADVDLDTLGVIDEALSKVDKARSNLGATQNRLQSTINNLENTANNLSAAQSRIQDADYATEVANMSKSTILQQVGTSVLAQANQSPNIVLSLLR